MAEHKHACGSAHGPMAPPPPPVADAPLSPAQQYALRIAAHPCMQGVVARAKRSLAFRQADRVRMVRIANQLP